MTNRIKLFTGNANPELAQSICSNLNEPLGNAVVRDFSDGEIMVEISENIRGTDVFVIQSTSRPGNRTLMEMLILIDALKRASAWRITAVIPYFGYARQDRKVAPRAPITAKLVANLITVAGSDRVLTMDLHAGQIQGFFDIPVDNLYAAPVLLSYLDRLHLEDIVVISPDAGGVERARAFAKRLKAGLAIIDKRRTGPNVSQVMHIVGDVKGKDVVIVDDIVDTGGTLVQGMESLLEAGARRIFACATHPVFSGSAIERLAQSPAERIIVTDTIPLQPEAKECDKIVQLNVAGILSEAIRRTHNHESVSSLFV
ncbi:MAG TPA: ribose-phosphate pyrophosphokinase [Proteobacteria bacterium]|nr:ribose-phosphate pyrophosphokinase [bacterium BMS3Abin14]HDL53452.1 ribose-phosphate pyrophosphokinase [Pseudomonadota bacterium]